MVWGILLPLAIASLAWPTHLWSLGLFLAYPLQVIRIARRQHKLGMSQRDAWLYSAACILGRFPNAVGLLRYASNRLLGWRQSVIEYKKNTPVRISADQRT